METIGLIGAGNMAEAIIRGITTAGIYTAKNIMASDVRPDRLAYIAEEYGIETTQDNVELVNHADVIIICVKPQNVAKMLGVIKGHIKKDTLFISIAAGITTTYLTEQLGNVQIIRVDEGATALYSGTASETSMDHAVELFTAVGKAVIVEQEGLIDTVTALSGSGPAYFFLLMEEMVNTARELGLPVEMAEELTFQTAKGAGVLAQQAHARGESPAELRRKVTSPGGTTEAAVHVFLERDFGGTIFSGLKRARDRSIELSREVEGKS